ncbi:NADase-type glycan-binding domain-containing protein [Micromonospora sp. NPDC001898]|uniref:zinc ribbon domain-containing protein n=1 Tax=Micromonospora sp. NPDC001898 TaxID=3364221 RepID=UPI0036C3FAC3
MRICDNCGAEVATGDGFCGTCGAFLAWDATDTAPAPATTTARDAPAGGGATPAATATGTPAGTGGTAAAEPPARTPTEPTEPTEPAAKPAAGTGDVGHEEHRAQERDLRRAAALVVPVRPADGTGPIPPPDRAAGTPPPAAGRPPVAGQPGAVLPGRPVAPTPEVRDFAGDRSGGADDVLCPACGTTNRGGSSFCRGCGRPLTATVRPTAVVPWWRRLRWPRRRPGRGRLRRLLAVLVVLVLVAGAVWAVARFAGPVVDAVRDRTAKPEAVLPRTVTASSEASGHPARSTVDGLNNRYWAPATDRPATGQYVELTFDPPIRLMDLIVHTGASPQQDAFVRQGRPAELTMTLWTRDGTSSTTVLRLTDRPGPQSFHHVTGGVARLRLTVDASYGAQQGRQVALAEIEVFRRP